MMSNRALVRVAAVVFALSLMACTPAESTSAPPAPSAALEVQRPAPTTHRIV